MSPEDAHSLDRHVAPEVSEHDLSHLGAYTAAARLVVDGEETPAFTLRTRPAPPAIPGRADDGARRQPRRPLPPRRTRHGRRHWPGGALPAASRALLRPQSHEPSGVGSGDPQGGSVTGTPSGGSVLTWSPYRRRRCATSRATVRAPCAGGLKG